MQQLLIWLLVILGWTTPTSVAEPMELTATSSNAALIEQIGREYGVDWKQAIKIATCESGLMQFKDGEVLRGKLNNQDVGLYQINEYYHLEASRKLEFDIYTTDGNIRYAMYLMKHQGIQPWNWSAHCHSPQ